MSSIITILFLVFIIATFREMEEMNNKPFTGGKEGGPRAELLELIGKMIDEKL
ncbi:MAG: hypothetical protein NTY88_07510 [Bacteroidetes bacterium]|nr:hypothetical protein [Bacteroidota bacterium]